MSQPPGRLTTPFGASQRSEKPSGFHDHELHETSAYPRSRTISNPLHSGEASFDPDLSGPSFPVQNDRLEGEDDLLKLGERSQRKPFQLGEADLDPLGHLKKPDGERGGMLMGPNHPGWYEIGTDETLKKSSPVSNPGRLPIGSIPPGARFDPIVPERPSGGLRPSSGIGRPRYPPLSGEPDNDELPPPGSRDMFM